MGETPDHLNLDNLRDLFRGAMPAAGLEATARRANPSPLER
jgi:hypothetical protein